MTKEELAKQRERTEKLIILVKDKIETRLQSDRTGNDLNNIISALYRCTQLENILSGLSDGISEETIYYSWDDLTSELNDV